MPAFQFQAVIIRMTINGGNLIIARDSDYYYNPCCYLIMAFRFLSNCLNLLRLCFFLSFLLLTEYLLHGNSSCRCEIVILMTYK